MAATMLPFAPATHAESPTGKEAQANPTVKIRLPERFRLLTDQLFDLRIEVTNLTNLEASVKVLLDGIDLTPSLGAPEVTANNDADASSNDKAWTFRSVSIGRHGVKSLQAIVTNGAATYTSTTRIGVQDFKLDGNKKSIILFIGDAMGTAYRDAARIVAMSTNNRFREGFFNQLQQMDQMPATGMVMTYALDRVVPDSANTATAWSTGNKTIDGALGVFPDKTDIFFKMARVLSSNTKPLDQVLRDRSKFDIVSPNY
jgi:alkaline phosphatase